jgi:hypothetical protein
MERMQLKLAISEDLEPEILNGIDKVLVSNGFINDKVERSGRNVLFYVEKETNKQNFHIWKSDSTLYVDVELFPSGLYQASTAETAFREIVYLGERLNVDVITEYDESNMIPRKQISNE